MALAVVFSSLLGFAVSRAGHNTEASKVVLDRFLERLQVRDYAGARQLCSTGLQDALSVAALQAQWQGFEQQHGALHSWSSGTGRSGSAASIFPPSVDLTYNVRGSHGGAGAVIVRVVPEGDAWRIQKLNLLQ